MPGHLPSGHQPGGHQPSGHTPDISVTTSEVPASSFRVDEITNSNAVDGVGYYEIDDRTGFKLYPYWHPLSKAKEDGYGWRTTQGDARHPQEFVRARGNDPSRGPQFAEPDVVFISASISPESL